MARRDLLAEAQVTAAAQVAPQISALQVALQTARADRNSAIHAAATAYKGLSGAIHRAGPQQRKVFSGAQRSAAGSDAIAHQTLGGLASSPGVDTIKAAYAHEGAVGGAVIAKALASRLADLSDKRIASAAGRAFQVSNANATYSAAAAKNAQQMQGVAQQQGLLTGANYSKLTEAAAGRKNQRLMQQRSLDSQAALQADRLTSQGILQSERLASQETVAGANRRSSDHRAALGRRQQKLGRINQQNLQTQRLNAAGGKAAKAPSSAALKGRSDIQALVDQYKASGDYGDIAKKARKAGFHESTILAAANLASKGYVAPREVKDLAALGVDLPKEWTGVTVRPHVRRRRGK